MTTPSMRNPRWRCLNRSSSNTPNAKRIHIICDNARYYRSKVVSEYLLSSKIELVFLPPYAPNLNLIERYGRFFKKEILYGKYLRDLRLVQASL
jgi:transposase